MENKRRTTKLAKKIASLLEEELEPNGNDVVYSLWDAILERRTKHARIPKPRPE